MVLLVIASSHAYIQYMSHGWYLSLLCGLQLYRNASANIAGLRTLSVRELDVEGFLQDTVFQEWMNNVYYILKKDYKLIGTNARPAVAVCTCSTFCASVL
jgi:hypothetical protein